MYLKKTSLDLLSLSKKDFYKLQIFIHKSFFFFPTWMKILYTEIHHKSILDMQKSPQYLIAFEIFIATGFHMLRNTFHIGVELSLKNTLCPENKERIKKERERKRARKGEKEREHIEQNHSPFWEVAYKIHLTKTIIFLMKPSIGLVYSILQVPQCFPAPAIYSY